MLSLLNELAIDVPRDADIKAGGAEYDVLCEKPSVGSIESCCNVCRNFLNTRFVCSFPSLCSCVVFIDGVDRDDNAVSEHKLRPQTPVSLQSNVLKLVRNVAEWFSQNADVSLSDFASGVA